MKTAHFSLKIKSVAIILVMSVFCSLWFGAYGPVLSMGSLPDTPYILLDGEYVDAVELHNDSKLRFEAVSADEATSYQWQIRDPENTERWISITDGISKYIWVTHALVGSMVDSTDTAYLRCRIKAGEELLTQEVAVTVSWKVPEQLIKEELYVGREYNAGAGEGEENGTYTIVINYLFDDNTMAFEPYGASVAAGSDFKASITSPTVVGYDPFRRLGSDYVDASVVEFDLKNIRESITVNVIYEPALVDFTVHHHLQNIHDDEYSVNYDLITTGKALTGSTVGDGLALSEAELPGFKPLAYEKLVVAADGSTVIEIRYDRNYYLVDFDMAGGYGTEPVYTRYGASVGANDPIRHGYLFDGWELVSYGGHAPTAEQQSQYALQAGSTVTVPAANLKYRARWITQETTYTMVFWCENADDSGYSYWGYLDELPAMSGSYVDGKDWVELVSGIEDEQYFTFNAAKTDRHVMVEGDGSTVVNVYYTRNYYTLTFKADGECTIPEGHIHGDACMEDICGQYHVHSEDCIPELECTTPEHTEHTADCIICPYEEHVHGSIGCECQKQEHTHVVACWNNVGSVQNYAPTRAPSDPENGQIYKRGTTYYIYLFGRWYRYTGRGVSSGDIVLPSCELEEHSHGTDCDCQKQEHTHSAQCYKDILHSHTAPCYRYSCGMQEHIHTDDCYRLICGIPEGHSHTGDCLDKSETNTVKTVFAKYGQSMKQYWPVTDGNGVRYDNGERWSPSGSSYYNAVLVYMDKMPPDDFTLTLNTASYKNYTMQYYLQILPGDPFDPNDENYLELDGKYYKRDNIIKAIYNYITKAEDFFDITGFEQYKSDPSFASNGQITTSGSSLTVNFYYDRIVEHYLDFNNNGTVLADKQKYGIMYGEKLKDHNFVPEYPSNLEPNAYTFKGWYTSPGCFEGTEVDWDTITMPEGDLMLYAKWAPVTHTVRVFKDDSLTQQIGTTQAVDHKSFALAPDGNVVNGNYIFQGWFYKEQVNGTVVEKAFSFNGIPIVQDMDIYAKWSSHVSVSYKIQYMIKDTDIHIADPTVGSAIAGHNKTFDAKAGDQLYQQYQLGYYPETNSHTITMSVDGEHVFTFWYVFVESMPYKVEYIDKETGLKLCEDKLVMDNSLSVVTETFKRFDKMMPDTYQKRLVLSANGEDSDEDGISDNNVITFYYNSDEEHAYYRVIHYIHSIHGDTYREYRSEEQVGLIGSSYTVNALTFTGFEFNPAKTVINGVVVPAEGKTVTTTLTGDGALIELYYDRQEYEYTVRYVDSKTDADLQPAKVAKAVFGEQILEHSLNLELLGYELVSDSVKTLIVSANTEHNVIEFLYQERTESLKYQIIGPAGCGSLTQYSENIAAISGKPNGSEPIENNGFMFIGWYADADCTRPVDASWVDKEGHIVPVKTDGVWSAATFYAKFVALETDLNITVKSTSDSDADQAFMFRIQGKPGTMTEGVDITVTVIGNSTTTVTKLPTGEYTVTELTDWSWRYENGTAKREIVLEYNGGSNSLIFDNSRPNASWLDGNAVKDNKY